MSKFPTQVKKQHFQVRFWNLGPITIWHNMTIVQFVFVFLIIPPQCTAQEGTGGCLAEVLYFAVLSNINCTVHLSHADKSSRIINSVVYRRWPNNVVPYTLDSAFTTNDKAIIAAVSSHMFLFYLVLRIVFGSGSYNFCPIWKRFQGYVINFEEKKKY